MSVAIRPAIAPFGWSVALHVAIAGLLLVSFVLPEDEVPQQAPPIDAVIVNQAVLDAVASLHKEDDRKRERQAADERTQEQAARVEREEKGRLVQVEADRVAAEQKALAAADARRSLEAEAKLKAEQQAKAKAAAAQKKKAEETRLKAERESDLRARLAEEEERTGAAFQGLKAQYIAAIQAHIERRWFKPPGTPAGASCIAVVTQIPGGEVVSVRFGTCGGGEALRQSIETAIRNASPLPPPPQSSFRARSATRIQAGGMRMPMIRRAIAVLLLLALQSPQASAELTVQILRGMAEAVPIAIVPFGWESDGAAAWDVAATVQADLERSGRFRALPRSQMLEFPHRADAVDVADWRMQKVDYIVVGQLQRNPDGRFELRYELIQVATGERLLGTALPADQGALLPASHRVADAIYERILGVRGAFATRIAYVAVEGPLNARAYRLIVADADGANERIVFNSPEPIMSPAWSRDGRSLAYVSFHSSLPAIYVQTLKTGEQIRVSARSGINSAPAWSPDGNQLAVALSRRDGNVDIYLLSLATQELRRVTDDPSIDTEPAWSPDGRSLYFTSDRSGTPQIYQLGLSAGDRPRRITFEGSYNARPRVSPDGRELAVVTIDRGAYRIAAVDLDHGAVRILTSGHLDESPSFAPNGADIIYATREGGRGVLALVSIDGRIQQRLAASAGEVREPAWSPFLY